MRIINSYVKYFSLLIFGIPLLFTVAKGQNYGLAFKGYDVTLDKRTELNLTGDDFMKFQHEFEISFSYKAIRLKPNSNAGFFGYIFRVINANDENIDLLSTPNPQIGLNLVLGKTNKIIPVEYSSNFINQWINLRVKFLLDEDRLILQTPDSSYVQENIGFENNESFKIIFGANDYEQFKSSDVPSMAVKDIIISENDKIKYHWPLNEEKGFVAADKIKEKIAKVNNPSWLVATHQNWQKVFETEIDGVVSVTANDENGDIFLVGKNELEIFSTQNNSVSKIRYKNNPLFFDVNYNTIFNTTDKKIYAYLIDEVSFYSLDITTGTWSDSGTPVNLQTKYRQHNSFYRSQDNAVYTFGGYGGHRYTNDIFRISLTDSVKTKLRTDETVYEPRYLAGIAELNDTIYILGGYGSTTGNQLINPHSFFNLIGYALQTEETFEKFKIPNLYDDMVVGNKMWIDNETRDFYALVFNKVKYENHYQLIKGNIDSPKIELMGDKIPFNFFDSRSFVQLFYKAFQKKLYAYTSYLSDSTTQIAIYSIQYPPNIYLIEDGKTQKENGWLIIPVVFAFLSIVGMAIYFLYRRDYFKNRFNHFSTNKSAFAQKGKPENTFKNQNNYHLVFFGGFQIFDKDFKDITIKFSPLLKELFLLIFLHSLKNDKGISTDMITEIIWSDKTGLSARNNLGVNIAKLKAILKEIGDCDISKKTGYWKINFSDTELKSDYAELLKITSIKKNLNKNDITNLIEITQKGAFLFNLNYEWLDEFKATVSDRTVDTLVEFGQSVDVKTEADFIIHLVESVFYFDIANEEAMILKCKSQNCMGKHSLAKASYEKFCKEYKSMYGQNYEREFLDILKN